MPRFTNQTLFRAALAGLIICLAAAPSACTAARPPLAPGEWQAADLLTLDPPEPDPGSAGADLIAVYARHTLQDLHLRLDLLDFTSGQDADVYIALDTAPGGTTALPLAGDSELELDALVIIPAAGELQVVDSGGNPIRAAGLWVARSPRAHTLSLRIAPGSLPGGGASLALQVFSALPGSREIADQTPPLGTGAALAQPLPVMLAFWDSFSASTAVQALRRWDGAHTGPFGGRHGLYNLLRTARARQVPLTLLDLSSPEALAALEYAGGLQLTREMANSRQLSLPDSLPGLLSEAGGELPLVTGDTLANWLASSRESRVAHSLPASVLICAPLSAAQFPALADALQGEAGRTILAFAAESGSAFGTVQRWGAHTLVRLPRAAAGAEPDRLDFAVEARRALAQAAWDWNQSGADPGRFLTLGGSLPESPFGSPQYARLAFQYLQEHPWVRLLSGHDLETLPPARSDQSLTASDPFAGPQAAAAALQPPVAEWGKIALRAIYTQPYPAPDSISALRSRYLALVTALDAAAAHSPPPGSALPTVDCTGDPDQDGEAECILATARYYAQVELDDGRLALLIARRDQESHLLVAPAYLLTSGLSDPAMWDLRAGVRADPQVLIGGFGAGAGPYSLVLLPNGVRLTAADGTVAKEYRLDDSGLAFHLRGPSGSAWVLPLVSSPEQRLEPGWWEHIDFSQEGNRTLWRMDRATHSLEASLPGRLTGYREGETMLGQPENPELDLPAGMFLPLGMAVVAWEGSELEGWIR